MLRGLLVVAVVAQTGFVAMNGVGVGGGREGVGEEDE